MKKQNKKERTSQAQAGNVPTIKPLSQGKLDSLCGLYCVVNAVRLISFPQTMGRTKSKDLIDTIASALGKKLAFIFENGTNDIRPILHVADTWLQEKYGRSLNTERPFRGKKPSPTPDEMISEISSHLAKPRTAAIVSTIEHWTVIQRVTAKRFILFDSDGLSSLRFDKQKRRDASRILPHQIFLLNLGEP